MRFLILILSGKISMIDFYCKFCGGKAYKKNNYWICPVCGARRPTDPLTGKVIPHKPWRSFKQLQLAETAHTLMDFLFETNEEKAQLYEELAKRMKMKVTQCHFSTMSIKQMEKAIKILESMVKEPRGINARNSED